MATAEAIKDSLAAKKAKQMVRQTVRDSTKLDPAEVVNTRVWNMFRESVEFKANAITPFQKAMAEMEAATLELYEGLLPLLRAPLPRVWDTVDGGLAEPIRATTTHNHPNIAGGEVNLTAIRASVQELEAKLQLKVRKPLTQWSDALETVRERIPDLERLRNRLQSRVSQVEARQQKFEKDTRKRMGVKRGATGARSLSARNRGRGAAGIRGAFYKCTHPKADDFILEPDFDLMEPVGNSSRGEPAGADQGHTTRSGAAGVDTTTPSGVTDVPDNIVNREFKKEELQMKLKDTQRQLDVAREGFSAEEKLMYEQLSGLCRDSAWAKSYVAAGLLMQKELFQETVFNLGETLQPLPSCKSLSNAPTSGENRLTVEAGARSGYNTPRGAYAPAGSDGAFDVAPAPGQLASNFQYNEAMPEYATKERAAHVLEELKTTSDKRFLTTRATASPLEVNATYAARGGVGEKTPRYAPALMPAASGRSSGIATPLGAVGMLGAESGPPMPPPRAVSATPPSALPSATVATDKLSKTKPAFAAHETISPPFGALT